ncbi:MAG: prephenate dehydrogenase/arogenate dehydrogenase family protein, partial [Gammaproteobacteria bacterium]|nr:prephenate dehydrogenase/arogenate dehydrogenase family protein [Gammaproteobacteria bacterium]
VAVPLGSIEGVFRQISGGLAPDAVITDVGSAKSSVIQAARAAFGEIPSNLVPAHPIAGTEKSGVQSSFSSLFQGRRVILTPIPENSGAVVDRVRDMWEVAGAEVLEMTPEHHDEVLAATSHLPHILAYALVDALARMDDRVEIFRYAAGGFSDFTRIASSDPTMWHDICLNNRKAILDTLVNFQDHLDNLKMAIRDGDSNFIHEVFARAKLARDKFAGSEFEHTFLSEM